MCRTSRADVADRRLDGLGKIGYCAGARRWFCGVREHLVFTPHGMLATVQQLPGNRHDSRGLYELLKTNFRGRLLADNAYSPGDKLDDKLRGHAIFVVAQTRKDARRPLPPRTRTFVHRTRRPVERRISLFCNQMQAGRTACRCARHYRARRWAKALTHNLSRYVSPQLHCSPESLLHFRAAA